LNKLINDLHNYLDSLTSTRVRLRAQIDALIELESICGFNVVEPIHEIIEPDQPPASRTATACSAYQASGEDQLTVSMGENLQILEEKENMTKANFH
jgi:hypothetical protein